MSKKEDRKKAHRWKMAARGFRLSPRHIQMAKMLGLNPKTSFDNWQDRARAKNIPLTVYIERRFVCSYGNADPMKPSTWPKKPKE